MINILLIIFWSLSYGCICFYIARYSNEKRLFMPYIAGALNWGWEINALLKSKGYWGHIIWLTLDCIILFYNIYLLKKANQQFIYIIFVLVITLILYYIFSLSTIDGMLLSSFIIDIIMALEYLFIIRSLSSHGRFLIGSFRLLGDMFAWIRNMQYSGIVLLIGILVLIINIFYLCYCLQLHKNKSIQ